MQKEWVCFLNVSPAYFFSFFNGSPFVPFLLPALQLLSLASHLHFKFLYFKVNKYHIIHNILLVLQKRSFEESNLQVWLQRRNRRWKEEQLEEIQRNLKTGSGSRQKHRIQNPDLASKNSQRNNMFCIFSCIWWFENPALYYPSSISMNWMCVVSKKKIFVISPI